MAWDAARPVPWKRLFTFVAIYSLVVLGIFALLRPSQTLQSIPGVIFGALAAVSIMAVLTKFGWNPTMFKSRAEIAEARAQRAAARQPATTTSKSKSKSTASAAGDGSRPKPAPTKRTSTGATNNPRRTRDTRKR
jgi:hypothetical protein